MIHTHAVYIIYLDIDTVYVIHLVYVNLLLQEALRDEKKRMKERKKEREREREREREKQRARRL